MDSIVVKGSHFFYKTNGTAFYVRGMLWYPFDVGDTTSSQLLDPLAEINICQRDIPYLSALRINVVWTYNIRPDEDHTECMNAFAEAGIYVIASLTGTATGTYLDSIYPAWNDAIFDHWTKVLDSLASFSNLLGVWIEYTPAREAGMPLLKAAVRDIKEYVQDTLKQQILVGWALPSEEFAFEGRTISDYMMCDNTRADFMALYLDVNSNCTSKDDIDKARTFAKGMDYPIFVVSVQCSPDVPSNTTEWEAIPALYTDGTSELNGGIIFWYLYTGRQPVDLGLVEVDSYNDEVATLSAYSLLSSTMRTISPSHADATDYHPTATMPAYPTTSWDISSVLPPKPYATLCSCGLDSLRCIAKPEVVQDMSPDNYTAALAATCGNDVNGTCAGIQEDAQLGKYGAFSMCNNTVKYSWAATQVWKKTGTCEVNGTTELRDERPAPNSDCAFLLNQTGENGEKTLTAFLASTPTAGTSPQNPHQSDKHGLSAGAKAGIAIGVLAFVILALLAALYVLRRMKKARKEVALPEHDQPDLPEYVAAPTEAKSQHQQNGGLPEGQSLMQSSPRT